MFFQTLSPFFYKKICEASKNGNCQIYLDGVSLVGFKEIARFAYTSKPVKLHPGNMLHVLVCATKCGVRKVQDFTTNYIESNINPENVFKILQEAKKLDLKRTEFKCYSFIEANPEDCKNSQDFRSLDRDLSSEIAKICKLEEPAKDWVEHSSTFEYAQENDGFLKKLCTFSDLFKEVKKAPKQATENAGPPTNQVRMNRSCSTSSTTSSKLNLPNHPKNITIPGTLTYKTYKEAELRILTGQKIVVINEIHFCYNIASLDTEFEIWISFIHSNKRKDLFYRKMVLKKTTEPFNRIIVRNGCKLLGGNREYMIKIEFPESKLRLVLDGGNSNGENSGSLKVVPAKEQEVAPSQIIKKIVYT
jgi:hypothetical protein